MEGVVYSTRATDPGTGREIVILELWIEKLSICINELHGAFVGSAPRSAINHFGTFQLPDTFCALVKEHLEKKTAFEEGNAKLFSLLKGRLSNRRTQHGKIV